MFKALLVSSYEKMVRDQVAMPFFYYKQSSEKFFLVGGQLFMFYEQWLAYISNGMTFYIKIAPMQTGETSISTTKVVVKSGMASTGACCQACLRLWNVKICDKIF